MPEPEKQSLLATSGVQGELIPIESLPDDFFVEDEQPQGKDGQPAPDPRYTAERFFSKRPEDYRLCVTFLAAGWGLLRIAKLLKVHHMTVAAVREREGAAIDIDKERIRKNIRLSLLIASERLPEIMATLPGAQVTLQAAILADKLRDMDGEPTQRIEHTHKVALTHDAIAASIEQFPDAIDVTATGSGASEEQQKALPSAAADADHARASDLKNASGSDTESGGSHT